MDQGQKKATLKYAERKYNGMYDFRFPEDMNNCLVLYVDCAKFDKNSPEYDHEYAKPLLEKPKLPSGVISFNRKPVLSSLTKELKEYLDIKIPDTCFWFKNYEYLDSIEKLMIDVTKKMEEPWNQIIPSISADQDSPKVKVTLHKIPSGYMDNYKYTVENYKKRFYEIDDSIDLDQYGFAITHGSPKKES